MQKTYSDKLKERGITISDLHSLAILLGVAVSYRSVVNYIEKEFKIPVLTHQGESREQIKLIADGMIENHDALLFTLGKRLGEKH